MIQATHRGCDEAVVPGDWSHGVRETGERVTQAIVIASVGGKKGTFLQVAVKNK